MAPGWGQARARMRTSRFTEEPKSGSRRRSAKREAGTPVAGVCRELKVTETSFCRWKCKYGGRGVSELREFRQPCEENTRLKRVVSDLTLDKQILRESLRKEF